LNKYTADGLQALTIKDIVDARGVMGILCHQIHKRDASVPLTPQYHRLLVSHLPVRVVAYPYPTLSPSSSSFSSSPPRILFFGYDESARHLVSEVRISRKVYSNVSKQQHHCQAFFMLYRLHWTSAARFVLRQGSEPYLDQLF